MPGWVRKDSVSHYGYKNGISIDATYGLVCRHVVTPADIHDSPQFSQLCWMLRRTTFSCQLPSLKPCSQALTDRYW